MANRPAIRPVSARIAVAAVVVLSAAIPGAGLTGIADAEGSSTSPTLTVSVEGVASVPISQTAEAAAATAAYREATAAAIVDGQAKAAFLAAKVGATVGAAQNVVEEGGSISCKLYAADEKQYDYEEYEGQEPDFGFAGRGSEGDDRRSLEVAPKATTKPSASAGPTGKAKHKHHKGKGKHKRKRAKKAAANPATTCTISAQVLLVYAIS